MTLPLEHYRVMTTSPKDQRVGHFLSEVEVIILLLSDRHEVTMVLLECSR